MEGEYEPQLTQAAMSTKKSNDNEVTVEVFLSGTNITNGAGADAGAGIDAMNIYEEGNDAVDDKAENIQEMEQYEVVEEDDGVIEELDGEDDAIVEEHIVEEEEDDGAEVGEEEEAGLAVERKPTQVPKKRKDAAILAAAADGDEEEGEEKNEKDGSKAEYEEERIEENEEEPTSSTRARAKKENTVDEQQCRVCTSKEDLQSLFKKVDKQTVADMLMAICPTVSIARKDFMPQYICNTCLDNVTIAVQLKNQCETTERELRKHLSRSKNKLRRPTGYVVIDAPPESDPPSEEEPNDDVEFKVSDEASASVDSEDSDFSGKKRRVSRSTSAKRGRRKSAVITPTPKQKEKKRSGRTPAKRSTGGNSSDEELNQIPKKKRNDSSETPLEFPCDECDAVFARKLSLVLHKKAHSTKREPLNCKICGKQFKMPGAYKTHLEKHKDEPSGHPCTKCDKFLLTKAELRLHLSEDHNEPEVVYQCRKCKRSFVTKVRLDRHLEGRCPGYEVKKKPDIEPFAAGKDLFKSVAPLTTTYWSDSFSD